MHPSIHPSNICTTVFVVQRMQINPLMHIYTCVVGVRIRRVSTGGPAHDSAGEEGGADGAKSRRGAEWYEDTQVAEHHWPRQGGPQSRDC